MNDGPKREEEEESLFLVLLVTSHGLWLSKYAFIFRDRVYREGYINKYHSISGLLSSPGLQLGIFVPSVLTPPPPAVSTSLPSYNLSPSFREDVTSASSVEFVGLIGVNV